MPPTLQFGGIGLLPCAFQHPTQNLPVSGITIQSGQYFSRTQRINTPVHAWDRVGVPDGYRIELDNPRKTVTSHPVSELKPRGMPGGLGRFNNALLEHPIDLLLSASRALGPARYGGAILAAPLSKVGMMGRV